jgi:hypothetical protein
MHRSMAVAAMTFVAGALVGLAVPPATAQLEEIQRVLVTNFPGLQKVAGTVSVEGPVRHAMLDSRTEIVVPPVDPKETGRLVDGGTLTMDGFTAAVLALNGQIRGRSLRPGRVGAILIPDEEPVFRFFEEEGQAHFRLEVSAEIEGGPARSFASLPTPVTVGFPRYRLRLYNTSERAVTVNLFAYLTH